MDWSTLISNVTKNVMSKIVEVPSMTVCSSLNLESLQLLLNTTDVTDTITDDARVRYSRQLKLVGSSDDSYHDDFCCPPVVDSSTWLGVVGGIAVVTFFLRQAITMNIGKRRKREANNNDVIVEAIDEFQNQNIVEDNTSYISSILGSFQDFLKDPDPYDDDGGNKHDGECIVELWKCMSGTLEDVVRVMDSKSSLLTSIQSVLAKVTFHGRQRSLWESLMSVPKVRTMVRCVKKHDNCLAHKMLLSHVKMNSYLQSFQQKMENNRA